MPDQKLLFPSIDPSKEFPIATPDEKDDPTLKALIASYEDHITTLKARISELENSIPARGSITPTPIRRPVLRTTSEIIAALEKQSNNFKHEVRDETK